MYLWYRRVKRASLLEPSHNNNSSLITGIISTYDVERKQVLNFTMDAFRPHKPLSNSYKVYINVFHR